MRLAEDRLVTTTAAEVKDSQANQCNGAKVRQAENRLVKTTAAEEEDYRAKQSSGATVRQAEKESSCYDKGC